MSCGLFEFLHAGREMLYAVLVVSDLSALLFDGGAEVPYSLDAGLAFALQL